MLCFGLIENMAYIVWVGVSVAGGLPTYSFYTTQRSTSILTMVFCRDGKERFV